MKTILLTILLLLSFCVFAQTDKDSLTNEICEERWYVSKNTKNKLSWTDFSDFKATAYFKRDSLQYVKWEFKDHNFFLRVFFQIVKCSGGEMIDRNTFRCNDKSYKVYLSDRTLIVKIIK